LEIDLLALRLALVGDVLAILMLLALIAALAAGA
jgi:hypothetical protein